jgi:S1/P1 Nuclease
MCVSVRCKEGLSSSLIRQLRLQRLRRVLLLVGMIACLPACAAAWGSKGHQIIARIAYDNLSSRARQQAVQLLKGATLESVSTWADDLAVRRTGGGGTHTVDIPLERDYYVRDKDCPNDKCLIETLNNYINVLASPKESDARRAEALKYVVHLVGDLHQPLNCADNKDKGGNTFVVTFFGRKTNLRAVWDTGLIDQTNMSVLLWAKQLEAESVPVQGAYTKGTIIDWALESHRLARSAYAIKGNSLDKSYYDAMLPIVKSQLSKGGIRLAKILNDTLR